MLKPSKFNYYTFNDSSDMLLLNTYSGRKIKLSPNLSERIMGYLNGETEDNNPIVKFLSDRGVLVGKEVDEGLKVRNLFTQIQGQSTLVLTVLPTEQCNFRCIYCPESFKRQKMSPDVQNAIIDYVRKNIHNYTGVQIMWFGGEPLMELDIISKLSQAIMQICKDKNRKYLANITTNAYLLDLVTFRSLLRYNVLDYQITIDGLRESHNRQRPLGDGAPTYDVIINNLLQIKQNVKTGKFRIMLRINVSQSMIAEIPQYIDWFKLNFGDDERFCLAVKMVGNYGGERVNDISEELISKNGTEDMFFGSMMASDLYQCKLICGSSFRAGGMLCTACMRNSLLIDSEGNFRKCTCNLDNNELNFFGNILDGRIDKKSYDYIRWNEPYYEKKCLDCFFQPVCMSSYCKYKSILSQKACCPEEKRHISAYLKILDKQGVFEVFNQKILI